MFSSLWVTHPAAMGFDFIVIAPLLPSHCGFSVVFGCGVSSLVSSSVFLLMIVQQSVVILVFSQEGVREHPFTPPSWFWASGSFWYEGKAHRISVYSLKAYVIKILLWCPTHFLCAGWCGPKGWQSQGSKKPGFLNHLYGRELCSSQEHLPWTVIWETNFYCAWAFI